MTKLTLASVIGGGGGTGGGGSTVFGFLAASLLAASALTGCLSDRGMAPSEGGNPTPLASIPCTADVTSQTVRCGSPEADAPTPEILGGQGVRVVLRSSNVSYALDTFRFDVTVQNLSTQAIGTNGSATTGVRVFFQQVPTLVTGTGSIGIEEDSTGDFTATGQSYYVYPESLGTREISSPLTWKFSLLPSVTTFTFTVLVAAEVGAYGDILRWSEVDSLGHTYLYGVGAAAQNDAMIVGDHGNSLSWDGSTWKRNPAVVADDLTSTQPLFPGAYIATGNGGRLYRSKGRIWTGIHQRSDNLPLTHIWVRDTSHWIAAGPDGAVTWYAAGTFTDEHVNGGTGEGIYAITGKQDGTLVTFLTDFGNLYSSTGPGAVWSGPDMADPIFFMSALDVEYDADGVMILSFWDLTFNDAYVRHGTDPDMLVGNNMLVTKIFPFDRDSVVIEVADNVAGTYFQKLAYGAAPSPGLTTISGTLPFANFGAKGAAMNAAKDQILLSDGTGQMWSVAGGSYEEIDAALNGSGTFTGIWGKGDSVWAIDGSGSVWKIVGNTRTQIPGIVGATGIWGFSGDELYVTAGNRVYRWDGTTWNSDLVMMATDDLHHIWGDPTSENLVAVGDNGRWAYRLGGGSPWVEVQEAGVTWTSVWGCDGNNAWLGTAEGAIYKWTFPGLLTLDGSYATDHGAGNWEHGAITGSSCTDVWAVGKDPWVFRYNGGSWDSVYTGIAIDSVGAAAMRGPQEAYIGGVNGAAALLTPFHSTRLTVPTHGTRISGLWLLQNGTLMASDASRILRGLR